MGLNLSTIDQADYPAGPAATQLNADYTLGPLFFGWGANLFLAGVVLAWAGTYFSTRAKADAAPLRLAVTAAVVFEVGTAVANLMSIIAHGKDQDRTNNAISLLIGTDAVGPLLGAVPALVAQAFFASRCHSLLPSRARLPFGLFIGALIAASFAGATGTTIIEFVNHGSTAVSRGASPAAYDQLYACAMVWLWGGVAADVTISGVLMARLCQKRREVARDEAAQESGAEGFLFGFMRLSFEVAVLTAVCATLAAGLYVTTTECTNLSYAFSNLLPGLYALSLLWALNSSHRLAQEVRPNASPEGAAIQLVWNLAPHNRDETLLQLARGGGSEHRVKLERGLAPSKAAQRFGQQVQMLTVSGRGGTGLSKADEAGRDGWSKSDADSLRGEC